MRALQQNISIPLVCLLFFSLPVLLPALHSEAATFTVNSGFDVNDLEPGNGLCVAYLVIIIPAVLPYCTLRGAIEEANKLPGEDVILLGSGTYRLSIEGRNEDQAGSGDLDITDSVHIIGAGADKTFIDANGLDRVFDIPESGTTITLSGISIINGNLPPEQPSHRGGGLRNQGNLTLDHVIISGNTLSGMSDKDTGGGMYNGGQCSLTHSIVHNNHAGLGAGIYNDQSGNLQVSATTLDHNASRGGGGLDNRGIAQLINTTITANSAAGTNALPGGGLRNSGGMRLVHCTIAGNTATAGGGGIYNESDLIMMNTLVADNPSNNCFMQAGLISQGGNLDSGTTCGLFIRQDDIFNSDPMLAPLENNGGPTPTMALAQTSPAVDAGLVTTSVTTDQRGLSRPRRKSFDIGAFELNNFSVAPCVSPLLLH